MNVQNSHAATGRVRRPHGYDPLAYYREHYDGLTRGELQNEDPALYTKIWQLELLDHIPEKHRHQPIDDFITLFHEQYEGLTRTELAKNYPHIHRQLKREGFIHHVPSVRRDYRKISNLVAYYHEHYEGLTRGELAKKDASLYVRLLADGLIDQIPKQQHHAHRQHRAHRHIVDALAYYRQHYDGLTRSELLRQDSSVYKLMRKMGLLDYIPLKINRRRA